MKKPNQVKYYFLLTLIIVVAGCLEQRSNIDISVGGDEKFTFEITNRTNRIDVNISVEREPRKLVVGEIIGDKSIKVLCRDSVTYEWYNKTNHSVIVEIMQEEIKQDETVYVIPEFHVFRDYRQADSTEDLYIKYYPKGRLECFYELRDIRIRKTVFFDGVLVENTTLYPSYSEIRSCLIAVDTTSPIPSIKSYDSDECNRYAQDPLFMHDVIKEIWMREMKAGL